ncbi:hypothetical protein PINS_up008787 [Pythium insidiosum]|nr:hypothetical protein PINS_up008787 [Pythium insidiosum]
MTRPWRRSMEALALLSTLLALTTAEALLTCQRTALRAVSDSDWRIFCEDAPPGSRALAFDPSGREDVTLLLTASAEVRSRGRLSATFQHVGPLVSSTLKTMTLQAEPEWVHKAPVRIDRTAFAQLTALRSL